MSSNSRSSRCPVIFHSQCRSRLTVENLSQQLEHCPHIALNINIFTRRFLRVHNILTRWIYKERYADFWEFVSPVATMNSQWISTLCVNFNISTRRILLVHGGFHILKFARFWDFSSTVRAQYSQRVEYRHFCTVICVFTQWIYVVNVHSKLCWLSGIWDFFSKHCL